MEHAKIALEIAQDCQFNNQVLLLEDRIRRLQKYPEEPVNDSEGVVQRVLGIVSATDVILESNTERGIFSTDESDFDFVDSDLLRQVRERLLSNVAWEIFHQITLFCLKLSIRRLNFHATASFHLVLTLHYLGKYRLQKCLWRVSDLTITTTTSTSTFGWPYGLLIG